MYKSQVNLPQQRNVEQVTNGISGLHDSISPTSRRLGQLSVSKNMKRFGVTGAETRSDRIKLGGIIGANILGLAGLYKSDGTKKIVSGSGTAWKVYNTSTGVWDNLKTGLTANKQFNAITFNDLLIMTNGVDVVQKYNGSTVSNLAGTPPIGKYIATAHKRVLMAGIKDNPHWLRVSDVAAPEVWNAEDSATIPINDKDGDETKWVGLYKTNIVVWKRYSMYEIHGPEMGRLTVDWRVFPIVNVGTVNGRTIASVNGVLYWLSDSGNSKGIVRWAGGRPDLISEPVENIIRSINYAHIDKACGATDGEGNYILAIPTGDSVSPNTILVFNTNDNSWWVWEDWSPTCFLSYRLEDNELLLMGDYDGYVYQMA